MAVSNQGFTDGVGLSIKVGATEWNGHMKDARFEPESEDGAYITFAALAEGNADKWYFRGTGFQSFKSASFWRYCWDNAGTTAVVTLDPYGVGATPTADSPHLTATATIKRPAIGGEAGEEFEFEVEWELTEPPTLDDGTP